MKRAKERRKEGKKERRKEGKKERRKEGKKERRTRGVKTFSELARPLTGAYVCLSRHRVQAHPASSAAIKLPFPTQCFPGQVAM